ncbi:MAG: phosphatidate cytidylyltransferase [Gemmatimonadaceae bacterium]|nr:phosphatidate cytidylyltransferase [Gemmatimonadaceae bacterium]
MQRLLFALVAIPLVVAAVWVGDLVLALLLAGVSALAAWEFAKLVRASGMQPLSRTTIGLAAALPLAVHAFAIGLAVPRLSLVVLGIPLLGIVAMLRRRGGGKPIEASATTLLGALATGGLLAFAYGLRYHPYASGAGPMSGTLLVMLPLLLTWATDVGGYLFGRTIGGPKLAPSISPNKTIAGAVGGALLAVAVAFAYNRWLLAPQAHLGFSLGGTLGFAVGVSIAAQLGDLVESSWKREAGVKDSSALIPGHGGVLDRIDSVLFALPTAYVLLDVWLGVR